MPKRYRKYITHHFYRGEWFKEEFASLKELYKFHGNGIPQGVYGEDKDGTLWRLQVYRGKRRWLVNTGG